MAKRYYWLKLKEGFFGGDDVKIIQGQENGPEYIVFWLKLLLRSISQEEPGRLRYKNSIPYNEKILSTVTDTDIDIVRSAMKLFGELEMIRIDEAGTIWIDDVRELVGSESSSAARVRKHREKQKMLPSNARNVTGNNCNENCNREKRREEIEKRRGGEQNSPLFAETEEEPCAIDPDEELPD